MKNSNKNILIVAGEVSGDHHGAALVEALQKLNSGYRFWGIGGDELKNLQMDIMYHITDMAFLGIGEVIRHLPFIFKVKNRIIQRARAEKPACAVLIDYPGFNLRLAKELHEAGIPVVYYISPQLWAWGKKRVKKIRQYVDKMIVLFPFEKKFYESNGIDAEYVGHPLVDRHFSRLPEKLRELDPENVVLGLLPGSRKQEIESLLPKMIETARQLHKEKLILRAEIVKVPGISKNFYGAYLDEDKSFISIKEKPLYELLPGFDAVIVASGTATLETGYYGVPMVIVYHVNPITYFLGRLLIKVPFIGLVNIVAEKQVAVELIQNDFTIAKAVKNMKTLLDPGNNKTIRKELEIIRQKLGEPGASGRAAEIIHQFITTTN